jgi:hypothetical protein
MPVEYDEVEENRQREIDLGKSLLELYEVGYNYYNINEMGFNADGTYTILIGYPDEAYKTRVFTRQEIVNCFNYDITRGDVATYRKAAYLNKYKEKSC